MTTKRGYLKNIILYIFWILYSFYFYLSYTVASPFYLTLIFILLILITISIFEFKEYHNIIYLSIISAVILTVMWVTIYLKPIPPGSYLPIYYMIPLIGTIIIVSFLIYLPREWERNKKALQPYDEALKLNPSDVIALNNKGVVLTYMGKSDKALELFDRVLEMEPEDKAALHNKSAIKEKRVIFSPALKKVILERISGLGTPEYSEKLFLEAKKRRKIVREPIKPLHRSKT